MEISSPVSCQVEVEVDCEEEEEEEVELVEEIEEEPQLTTTTGRSQLTRLLSKSVPMNWSVGAYKDANCTPSEFRHLDSEHLKKGPSKGQKDHQTNIIKTLGVD